MELIKQMLKHFVWLFGGTVLGMYVYRLIIGGGAVEMNVLTGLLILCAVVTALNFILYSNRWGPSPGVEVSRKRMLVFIIFHLAMTLVLIVGTVFLMGLISLREPGRIILLCAVVIGVYVLMVLQSFSRSKKDADEINEKLKERYK